MQRFLGLDIGDTSIKLLELSQRHSQLHVEHYAIAPTLKQAIKASGTRLRHAAIALPDSDIITKVISLETTLSEEEQETLILANTETYFHCAAHEVHVDFEALNEKDLLLVAARSAIVQTYTTTVTKAGLTLALIDIQSHALARTLELTYPDTVFIHVSASGVLLIVLKAGKIVFSRVEPLPTPTSIRRALNFFLSAHPHYPIHQILLAGETTDLELDFPTQVAEPAPWLSLSPPIDAKKFREDTPQLLTAFGLALRNFN